MKKFLVILMVIVFMIMGAACGNMSINSGFGDENNGGNNGGNNNGDGDGDGNGGGNKNIFDLIDEIEVLELRGTETEVSICIDSAIMPAQSGYSDVILKSLNVTKNTPLSGGLVQYLFTSTLHNECVEDNVRLKLENYGWGEPLLQQLTNAFLSNRGPDIIIGEAQMPAFARENRLKPFPDDLAAYVREKMHPVAYQAMEYDGKIYGVATNASIPVLIWNTDLLRSAGVSEEMIQNGPSTWAELLSVGDIVNSSALTTYAGGIYCGSNFGGYLRSTPFVYQNGGSLVDSNGAPKFDTAENLATFEFLRQMSDINQRGMMASTNEETMVTNFNSGKLGFCVDGSWRIQQAREAGINVNFSTLPSPSGTSKVNVPIGAGYYAVASYSTKADDAFKVIWNMLEDKPQNIIADCDVRPCSRLDIAEAGDYAERSPTQAKVYDILKDTIIKPLPSFVSNQEQIWQAYGEALTKTVYYTKNAPEDIWTLLQTAQSKAVNL